MKLMRLMLPMLAAFVLFSTACEEDTGGGGGGTSNVLPSTSLNAGTDLITSTGEVEANGSFEVELQATAGDSPLKTITVSKNSVAMDIADIAYDGTPASANPALLLGTETSGFTKRITIKTDLEIGDAATYTFQVEADNGDIASEVVTISVKENQNAPILEYPQGINFEAKPGTYHSIKINGMLNGGSDLATLSVYENGVLGTPASYEFKGVTFDTNPYVLLAEDAQGFTNEMFLLLTPQDLGDVNYDLILSNVNGLSDTVSFTVTVGTPMVAYTSHAMYNFVGPEFGSLKLPDFQAVGQADTDWVIRDNGNDGNGDWTATFRPNTGVTLKAISASWDDLIFYEDMQTAFDGATAIASSTYAQVGDIYMIEAAGALYALQVKQVENTSGDNRDYMIFDVKEKE